jgi:hypothetical protein
MNRYGYGYPLGIMFGGIFAAAWAAYNERATADGANAIEQSAQDCLYARYVNILNYL